MVTNLEWLYENDKEALVSMIVDDTWSDICSNCPLNHNDFCDEKYMDLGCHDIMREWLNSEYVDVESWELVKKEAAELDDAKYCYKYRLASMDTECTSNEYYSKLKAEHLVERCIKLAEKDKSDSSNKQIDWKKFEEGKLAVNCPTEESANNFLKELDKRGYTTSIIFDNKYARWDYMKYKTCYSYNCIDRYLDYGSTDYYNKYHIDIVTWE